MTETKRNSVGGRVATPKNTGGGPGAPQGFNDQDAAILKAIGGRVRVTTSIPNSSAIEGTLFTVDPATNVLAIDSATNTSPNSDGNFHLLPVALVKELQIISLAASSTNEAQSQTPFTDLLPSISAVNLEALRAREEAAIRKMREFDGTRGKGVSKEAQEIYDWFHRTLPVSWHNQAIVINRSVILEPPYTLESMKAPKDKQQAMEQIKRVLSGYYNKKQGGINTPSTANSGTSTPVQAGGNTNRPVVPALPRKGG